MPKKTPKKRQSKSAGSGKGRGRGRPVKRALSQTDDSGNPDPTDHEIEVDPATEKPVTPDTVEIPGPHAEPGVAETEDNEGTAQSNASSPSHSSISSQIPAISKKPKQSCPLKDETEEGVVLEWVQEHPCLWDMKHRDFKNRHRKDRLWDEKAQELGYTAVYLKSWYITLRDWNTKLHSQRSGDGQREFTDRELWIMDHFMFLRANIRHRRAPVKSVKEALAIAGGNLDEAEKIAAEDRIAIQEADEDPIVQPKSCEPASAKPKKSKRVVDDPLLIEMRKKFDAAQSELTSVRTALATTEPTTERTAFLDWVREVCKNASDDQFGEFQTSFIQLQTSWKRQEREAQERSSQMACSASSSYNTDMSAVRECYQPMPSQWRMPPPQLPNASPWQSQSSEYMQAYMQQPYTSPPTSLSGTPQAISSALCSIEGDQ